MSDAPHLSQWKKFLRYDPTRWLLATNDPSILLWYQLDIAHRPEDARAVLDTRDRVLYSEPVQTIFAAQDALGFWGDAEQLAQPYYTATLWNLALLAELGIPRASRRARNACEFILQNFLRPDGAFAGLNAIETGFLLRAFGYFNYAGNGRVLRAARHLSEHAASFDARVCALWGCRAFCHDVEIARAAREIIERVLQDKALGGLGDPEDLYTVPQFQPRDELFLLRVLAEYERVNDARVAPLTDRLIGKQNERAQWTLERDWNARLLTPLENQNAPSRWLTLNALRVITQLVLNEKKED
jgi:hypothetical protein